MDAQHEQAVQALAETIKGFDGRFRVYHGSTCSTRYSGRRNREVVDISGLNRVSVDEKCGIAIAEPCCCTMGELVRATLARGLVPAVVPEFPNITVGGAFAGIAGESSSFNDGPFSATVVRIEVILLNGEKVDASPDENADLFTAAAGTLGTLGVVTLLHVRLRKSADSVQLTFTPVLVTDLVARTEQAMRPQSRNDFVEAIMFDRDSGVMITGRMTDESTHPRVRFSRAWDPWFYLFARRARDRDREVIACTPLIDYLFRYDRGAFWVGELAFRYFLTPFNRLTRLILDPLMRTEVLYRGAHGSGLSRQYIIQDIAVPPWQLQSFLSVVDRQLAISPLWICPVKVGRIGLMPRGLDERTTPILYNVGIWGPGSTHLPTFRAQNLALEDQARLHDGCKCSYAMVFCRNEEEFWGNYRREDYERARLKHGAEKSPTVWDKMGQDMDVMYTSPQGTWPFQGLRGVWSAVFRPKLKLL